LGTETRHCKSIPGGDTDLAAERLRDFTDPFHHSLVARHDQRCADGDAAPGDGGQRELCTDITVEPDGFRGDVQGKL